jgi:hypothetical protein
MFRAELIRLPIQIISFNLLNILLESKVSYIDKTCESLLKLILNHN